MFKDTIGDLTSLDFYSQLSVSLTKGFCNAEIVLIMMLTQRVRNMTLNIHCSGIDWKRRPDGCNLCHHRPGMEEAVYTIFDPARLAQLREGAYSNLKEMVVESNAKEATIADVSYKALNNIFQLSSLERLTCNSFDMEESASTWTCPDKASSLSELDFGNRSGLDIAIYSRMVRSCKTLKRV